MTNSTTVRELKKSTRQSNIELLRIISMILIVFHHFAIHSGFSYMSTSTIPELWINFISLGGKIGSNIFVLISGYFLISNEKPFINIKRITRFWMPLFFYSVLFFGIFAIIINHHYDIKSLVESFFPITFTTWWFASTYFVLYLLHPFINLFLKQLTKKQFQGLIVLLIAIWCILPTLTQSAFQGNYLTWFVTLYCISAYIKLFGLNHKFKLSFYSVILMLAIVVFYLINLAINRIGERIPLIGEFGMGFYYQERIPSFLVALLIFIVFSKINMRNHQWINIISSACFGVYLISDHPLVRKFCWQTFNGTVYQNSLFIIPYSFAAVFLVYVLCSALDLIRQYTVHKLFITLSDRALEKINPYFKKIPIDLFDPLK